MEEKLEEIKDLAFTILGKCTKLQQELYMKKEHKGVTFLDDLHKENKDSSFNYAAWDKEWNARNLCKDCHKFWQICKCEGRNNGQ